MDNKKSEGSVAKMILERMAEGKRRKGRQDNIYEWTMLEIGEIMGRKQKNKKRGEKKRSVLSSSFLFRPLFPLSVISEALAPRVINCSIYQKLGKPYQGQESSRYFRI